ncbi:MAG: hypothetical protein ABIZ81_15350, partial [Opitutaceae bacterium]
MARVVAMEGDSTMNLSAPNIPPRPSPYAKASDPSKVPDGVPTSSKTERFEELFADVAQRRESRGSSPEARPERGSSSRRERASLEEKHSRLGNDQEGRTKKKAEENILPELIPALAAEPLRAELVPATEKGCECDSVEAAVNEQSKVVSSGAPFALEAA